MVNWSAEEKQAWPSTVGFSSEALQRVVLYKREGACALKCGLQGMLADETKAMWTAA